MPGVPVDEQHQMIGLGVLIGVGAILLGYVVRLFVPAKHFPWTAGLLASNAVVAACAYAGVSIAGVMIEGWLIASIFAFAISLRVDLFLQE